LNFPLAFEMDMVSFQNFHYLPFGFNGFFLGKFKQFGSHSS